jgi:hypothetical protein
MDKNTVCKILMVLAGAVQGIAVSPIASAYASLLSPVATALGVLAGLFHASPASIQANITSPTGTAAK